MSSKTPEHWVKMARVHHDQSRRELAERLAELTDDDGWTYDRVSAMENGRRDLRVAEMEAFAEAQGVDVLWYLGRGITLVGDDATVRGDSGASLTSVMSIFTTEQVPDLEDAGIVAQLEDGTERRAAESLVDAADRFAARRHPDPEPEDGGAEGQVAA